MKFEAYISEVVDDATKSINWYWTVASATDADLCAEGVAENDEVARHNIYVEANCMRVDHDPLTDSWTFEL